MGLLDPSQRKEHSQSSFPSLLFSSCGGRKKQAPTSTTTVVRGYKQKALERGGLRPLLLRKETTKTANTTWTGYTTLSSPLTTPSTPRTPIDFETQQYLRSPTAFGFEEDGYRGTHRRSRHVWSARPLHANQTHQAGAEVVGMYPYPGSMSIGGGGGGGGAGGRDGNANAKAATPPLVIRKRSDGYSLVEYEDGGSPESRTSELTVKNRHQHQSYRSPYDLNSPSRDCTREELDMDVRLLSSPTHSTYSSYPTTPTTPITPRDDTSSLYTISESEEFGKRGSDVVVIKPGEEDHAQGRYLSSYYGLSVPLAAHAKKKDEVFVIGDATEPDFFERKY